jgi:hypothetical protein
MLTRGAYAGPVDNGRRGRRIYGRVVGVISRRTQAVLLVIVVAATFLLTGLWQHYEQIVDTVSATGRTEDAPAGASAESDRARALTVLRAWDERRAAAYAAGDPVRLRKLYLPKSVSGDNDRRVFQTYAMRGLTVERMRTQVLRVEVTEYAHDSLTLVVTDRLAVAVAVGTDTRVRLPRDQASTRQIELRRVGEEWLVAEVRAVESQTGDRRSQPRPVESTSRTVGSWNR